MKSFVQECDELITRMEFTGTRVIAKEGMKLIETNNDAVKEFLYDLHMEQCETM